MPNHTREEISHNIAGIVISGGPYYVMVDQD